MRGFDDEMRMGLVRPRSMRFLCPPDSNREKESGSMPTSVCRSSSPRRPGQSGACVLLALSLLLLAGCGGATANVRALRMYQREEVTPELLNEHLRQLDETLALIRRIHQTPYRPGDDWVRALPLDETRAAAALQTLRRAGSIESKPSLLSLYNTHARELLDRVDRAAAVPAPVPVLPPVLPPAPPAPASGPAPPDAPATSPPAAAGADF